MPDISNLSVEELRKLTAEAEALIESKKTKRLKMHIMKSSKLQIQLVLP